MPDIPTLFTVQLVLSGGVNDRFTLGSGVLIVNDTFDGNYLATSNLPAALRELADAMDTGSALK